MMIPRNNPHIYEINLITWLHELSYRSGKKINLGNIPEVEWKYLRELGMDFVWLMGMWRRSPYSSVRARGEGNLVEECRSILKDFKIEDIVGSPYAVFEYIPDPAFGSVHDLALLKEKLDAEGLGLILDFVPNHTACDYYLVKEAPDFYVQGARSDTGYCEPGFFMIDSNQGGICVAHGKDPYFPPWTDTAQLNYSRKEVRAEMSRILAEIASMCDGLRCDMSMLVMKDVFQKTWMEYVGYESVDGDFWPEAIEKIGAKPGPCLLLAEAYWGRESELLEQGFDYVYDKAFYDLLARREIAGLKEGLSAPVEYLEKMLRFLENHDEPRGVTSFGRFYIECAMVALSTLPGAKLWQHGQFEGRQIRVPVQLKRAPEEKIDIELKIFSENLLKQTNHPIFHEGLWELCDTYGWEDNQSHHNLLAWSWRMDEERCVVITNFYSSSAQGYVRLSSGWLPDRGEITFKDPIKGNNFLRSSSEVIRSGLYVELGAGDFHFFWVERV